MPQTVYDVGDPITSRLKLGVTPDGTTSVTAVVMRPDGTVIAGLTVSPTWSGAAGDEKTVQFYATNDGTAGGAIDLAAGDWVVVWTVAGTGASTSAKVYNVAPLPGTSTRPTWSPFLSDIADHVPFLTIDQTAPGSQFYLGTFTGNTSPTDEQAQRHVDIAVAIVGAGFSVLTGSLPRMARSVAALWAAASLCRAFARDADTRQLADSLSAEAKSELKILQTAVENAGSSALSPLPVLVAPAPASWGDDLDIGFNQQTVRWVIWPE